MISSTQLNKKVSVEFYNFFQYAYVSEFNGGSVHRTYLDSVIDYKIEVGHYIKIDWWLTQSVPSRLKVCVHRELHQIANQLANQFGLPAEEHEVVTPNLLESMDKLFNEIRP